MWDALREICKLEGASMHIICEEVEARRGELGRTAAIRVFIVSYFRALVRGD